MTFLPIVGRELRVAARKRSTFWVRIAAAVVAVIIGTGLLGMSLVGWLALGTASFGKGLFGTLTWLSLAAALSTGLFFTSDCLSEEKREGTLGFLFLTDLTGYDVVLGKLVATSLRSFFALLAVLPILALTLVMGGVTGVEFWKTALALVNALLLSLAVGLFVSSISRESHKALAATLGLLALLVAGGPVIDWIVADVQHRSFNPILSLSSSGFVFAIAGAWGRTPFWWALLINQIMTWALLGCACCLLPRTWQDSGRRSLTVGRVQGWKFGGTLYRERLRRKLVGVNPVLWLACRERWPTISSWVVSLLMAGGLAGLIVADESSAAFFLWSFCSGAMTLVLYLAVASQAGRFFVDARRTGLSELLLVTPLTDAQIIQGQWRAFLRMCGLPLVLYLAAQLLGAVLVQQMTWSRVASAPAPPPPPAGMSNTTVVTTTATRTTVTVTAMNFALEPSTFVALATSIASALVVGANFAALWWFGMWMGLTSQNNNLATLKTIVFVQIVPWIAVSFAAGMIVPLLLIPVIVRGGAPSPQATVYYRLLSSVLTALLLLIKDGAFVLWSHRKLSAQVRGFEISNLKFQIQKARPR